jgi:hypothetical protein
MNAWQIPIVSLALVMSIIVTEPSPAAVYTLYPTDDAWTMYDRGDETADGVGPTLDTWHFGSERIPAWQESYLKFDLSGLPDGFQFESAVLSIYAIDARHHNNFNEPYETWHYVEWVFAGDGWSEQTVQWGDLWTPYGDTSVLMDARLPGTNPNANLPDPDPWKEFDLWNDKWGQDGHYLTDLQDGAVTLMLRTCADDYLWRNCESSFYSKDYMDGDYHPRLRIEGVPEPASVTLLIIAGAGCLLRRQR